MQLNKRGQAPIFSQKAACPPLRVFTNLISWMEFRTGISNKTTKHSSLIPSFYMLMTYGAGEGCNILPSHFSFTLV